MSVITPDEAATGRRRMKVIARKAEVEIDQLVAQLLEALGRPPEAVEVIWAEATAAAHVRCARLRKMGRNDNIEMANLVRLLEVRPREIVGEVDRNVSVLPRPATQPATA